MLAVLEDLLGPAGAKVELGRVAKLVGLQFYEEAAAEWAPAENAQGFANWMKAMLDGQGEAVTLENAVGSFVLRLNDWKLVEGLGLKDPAGAFGAWNELWAGACAAHDRFIRLESTHTAAGGSVSAQWRIAPY